MLAFFWYTKHILTNFVEFLCASNNVKVMEHVYQNVGNIISKDSLVA
jgi:hypothetical protein